MSRASIYSAWCAIAAIGLCGYYLFRRHHPLRGLFVLAIYAVLGLDGLLHYARAPVSAHTLAMNATIWAEVVAAALVLGVVLWLAVLRLGVVRADVRDV